MWRIIQHITLGVNVTVSFTGTVRLTPSARKDGLQQLFTTCTRFSMVKQTRIMAKLYTFIKHFETMRDDNSGVVRNEGDGRHSFTSSTKVSSGW